MKLLKTDNDYLGDFSFFLIGSLNLDGITRSYGMLQFNVVAEAIK